MSVSVLSVVGFSQLSGLDDLQKAAEAEAAAAAAQLQASANEPASPSTEQQDATPVDAANEEYAPPDSADWLYHNNQEQSAEPEDREPHSPPGNVASADGFASLQAEVTEQEIQQPEQEMSSATTGPARVSEPANAGQASLPAEMSATASTRQKYMPTGRKHVHSKPDHLLLPLSPYPACSTRLNFNGRRVTAIWRSDIECPFWIEPLSNKSCSCSFGPKSGNSWQAALHKVHTHAWEKWGIANAVLPAHVKLSRGEVPQVPGNVPDAILQALEPIINDLPPIKKRRT